MSASSLSQQGVISDAPETVRDWLEGRGIPSGSYRFEPLSAVRKIIARRTSDSVSTTPHFSVDMKIEMDALLGLKGRLNTEHAVRISVNDMLIRAAGLALIRKPSVNVTFAEEGIVYHNGADVAFAVAIEGGLVTPIVRSVEAKSLPDIARETADLGSRGRSRRLKPHEYQGGTFSISNLGMYGVERFDAIINQPHGAILSVGTAEKRHVFDNQEARVATIMTATLTSDHRVIDGAVAAAWLWELKDLIENPAQLLS